MSPQTSYTLVDEEESMAVEVATAMAWVVDVLISFRDAPRTGGTV